jgi:hypothetical protein
MAKRYMIAIFNKMEDSDGNNVLDGLTYIPCFNKVAYFKAGNRHFRIDYPDVRSLPSHEKKVVRRNTLLEVGVYGYMAECYGKLKEIDVNEYNSLLRQLPLSVRHRKYLSGSV